jgi:hypothetical protein
MPSDTLSEEELEAFQHLNVEKGFENPFIYFSKKTAETASPFMKLCSDLTLFSKIVKLYGEDFIPRTMSVAMNKEKLLDQLIESYEKMTHLVQKLLIRHIF